MWFPRPCSSMEGSVSGVAFLGDALTSPIPEQLPCHGFYVLGCRKSETWVPVLVLSFPKYIEV